MGATDFNADVTGEKVAWAGQAATSFTSLPERPQSEAMQTMPNGLTVRRLYDEGILDGIIGMDGIGGTSIATTGVRVLPVGVPEAKVSTVAGADVGACAGTSDVVPAKTLRDCRRARGIVTESDGTSEVGHDVETNFWPFLPQRVPAPIRNGRWLSVEGSRSHPPGIRPGDEPGPSGREREGG